MEQPDEVQDLSQEELKERRQKITDYYSEHIPHLKIQLEYEQLLADIERLRVDRIKSQLFLAQMAQEQEGEDFENEAPPQNAKKEFDNQRKLQRK